MNARPLPDAVIENPRQAQNDRTRGPEVTFRAAMARRTLTIGVVGLGTTGLPLAVAFADTGFPVLGYDIDPRRLAALERHELHARLRAGRLAVTAQAVDLAACDVVAVCVPTPATATRAADLSALHRAVADIGTHTRTGATVLLQSTVPPGTTQDVAQVLARQTGRRLGAELFVAYCPERIDPGPTDVLGQIRLTPRLVAGVTSTCTDRARAVLSTVVRDVVPVADPATAETAKLTENAFRLVNIALAFQINDFCLRHGLSTRQVVDAAATKPFGFLAHYPSAGVGGDCIPTDPHFLEEIADPALAPRLLSLIRHAGAVVDRRPHQVARRALQMLGTPLDCAHVALLGVSYKPCIADTCNSPARQIGAELLRHGIEVTYVDPYVPKFQAGDTTLTRLPADTFTRRDDLDLAILVTPHPEILRRLASSPPTYPILDCGDHIPDQSGVVAI